MATSAKKPYAAKRDASVSRVPVSAKRDVKGAMILKKVRGGQTQEKYVTSKRKGAAILGQTFITGDSSSYIVAGTKGSAKARTVTTKKGKGLMSL